MYFRVINFRTSQAVRKINNIILLLHDSEIFKIYSIPIIVIDYNIIMHAGLGKVIESKDHYNRLIIFIIIDWFILNTCINYHSWKDAHIS